MGKGSSDDQFKDDIIPVVGNTLEDRIVSELQHLQFGGFGFSVEKLKIYENSKVTAML